MSLPVATGLTIEDLEAMPDEDGIHRELVDGELYVSPTPVLRHQRAVMAIVLALGTHVRQHGGEVFPSLTAVTFGSDDTWVEPDVVALSMASVGRIDDDRFLRFPPDLVVEVSSPSTRRLDVIRKRGLYERVGVPEYWFVDLDEDVVDVYRLDEGGHYGEPTTVGVDQHLTCRALSGFEMPVAEAVARAR